MCQFPGCFIRKLSNNVDISHSKFKNKAFRQIVCLFSRMKLKQNKVSFYFKNVSSHVSLGRFWHGNGTGHVFITWQLTRRCASKPLYCRAYIQEIPGPPLVSILNLQTILFTFRQPTAVKKSTLHGVFLGFSRICTDPGHAYPLIVSQTKRKIAPWSSRDLRLKVKSPRQEKLEHCQIPRRPFQSISFLAPYH